MDSDVNKDLGPKAKTKERCHKAKDFRYQGQGLESQGREAKAKDSRSHKTNVQRQYMKVKDDNDHKFYVFHS